MADDKFEISMHEAYVDARLRFSLYKMKLCPNHVNGVWWSRHRAARYVNVNDFRRGSTAL